MRCAGNGRGGVAQEQLGDQLFCAVSIPATQRKGY